MDKIIKKSIKILAYLVFIIFLSIVAYVVIKGLPHINLDLFKLKYDSNNLSLLPALISTIIVIIVSLSLSLPIGILTSIYLSEYTNKNMAFNLINLAIETLAGIPSIIYGLFGMIFFVNYLGLGFSILSGSLTLSIMVLPLIIESSKEALTSVAGSLREASLALGASRTRTIFKVLLPAASPGILSGIILSIGRIVGESAALIYTAGTVAKIPLSFFDSARTLSVHMYVLSSEGLHTNAAYATAFILMLIVLLINYLSNKLANKFMEDYKDD